MITHFSGIVSSFHDWFQQTGILKKCISIFQTQFPAFEVTLYINSGITYTFGIQLAFYTESAFCYVRVISVLINHEMNIKALLLFDN
jgi:hypothetical protein